MALVTKRQGGVNDPNVFRAFYLEILGCVFPMDQRGCLLFNGVSTGFRSVDIRVQVYGESLQRDLVGCAFQ